MKKIWALMALCFIFCSPVMAADRINGEEECQVTDELKVWGTVDGSNNIVVLNGKLHNTSTYMEYKNTLVQAELCDEHGNTVGLMTFSIEEDVEKGETEHFEVETRPLARVTSVDYKVICAERDFAGLGY